MASKTDTADRNFKLAKRIGAPSYDPTVPDDNLYWLRHGKGTLHQTYCWIHEHTFAGGHPEHPEDPECRRSPYCVDTKGKALFIEDLARDRGWAIQTARNALVEAEEEGFCKVNHEQRQIWRCGRIPKAYQNPAPGDSADSSEPADLTEEQLCTKLPDYLREKITTSDSAFRKKALGAFRISLEWYRASHKDAVAQLRAAYEQSQDSMWAELGLGKKRIKKRRGPDGQVVKLKLLHKPNFVQSYEDFVQNAETGSYKPQEACVQTENGGASLYTQSKAEKTYSSSSSVDTPQATTTTSFQTPEERETDWILEQMERWCGDVEPTMAERLLIAAGEKWAPITAGEICDLINEVGKARGKLVEKADSPPAYLTKAVLNKIDPEVMQRRRQEKQATASKSQAISVKQRREMEAILADPNVPNDEKELARIALGERAAGGGAA